MGKLSQGKKEEALRAYFEEGLEPTQIALRMKISEATVTRLLGDPKELEPYRQSAEAAKLRAQICVSRSAEEAARRQAELLRCASGESVVQRAATDILNRAGVKSEKEEADGTTVTFRFGMPELGMPEAQE